MMLHLTAAVRALPSAALLALAAPWLASCSQGTPAVDHCAGVACGTHAACLDSGTRGACVCDPGFAGDAAVACLASAAPTLGGCALFPADHLFNTPIDALPVHPQSAAYLATIGSHRLHLDLGTTVDPASASYWGIPYNVVSGASLAWSSVHYDAGWPDESDCAAAGATATVRSPCSAASPVFPVPAAPLVEGGIDAADEDHHLLVVDADACRLWEAYHLTPRAGGGWDVLSTASWDLGSSALRPPGWTSSDAAGFPVLPLLLRAAEAGSGAIRHALRFTIPSNEIRTTYTWPARHLTGNGTASVGLPEMGQLFRLRASYPIPAGAGVQSRAILQALKTYGMYLADGGSSWYVQGEPSAAWDDAIFPEVQAVGTGDLEAVDLAPFRARAGWSAGSARVPPP
jgi:hypothetical protein